MIKKRNKGVAGVDDVNRRNLTSDELLNEAGNAKTFDEQAVLIMQYLKSKGDDWYAPGRYGGMYLNRGKGGCSTFSKLFGGK